MRVEGARQRTHETLVGECRASFQMEKDGHVVFVVGRIESCDIDERVTHTVPKVLRVQCWSPAVCQPYGLALAVGILNILAVLARGSGRLCGNREERPDENEKTKP